MYVSTYGFVNVSTSILRGQKNWVPLELELWVLVSHLMQVLGTELGSFARRTYAHNHWAIFQPLACLLAAETIFFAQLCHRRTSCMACPSSPRRFWSALLSVPLAIALPWCLRSCALETELRSAVLLFGSFLASRTIATNPVAKNNSSLSTPVPGGWESEIRGSTGMLPLQGPFLASSSASAPR